MTNSIKTALRIDKLIGRPISIILGLNVQILEKLLGRKHVIPMSPSRILITKFMGIGSIIQALPLIMDLKQNYSQTEIVDDFEDIQHELVREAMRLTGVTSGVEITTIAEIPSRGTGLGSSSAVTVGLLNALHHFAGNSPDAITLAQMAPGTDGQILTYDASGNPVAV